ELTSNTATAATFLPVAGGVAMGLGIDPMLLAIPVALAATCAFMLPVATPPNAIAFGSGYVTISQMIRGGIWLNVFAMVVITIATMTLAVWVFGLTY
ncbi:MAG: carboxylate transporter, partial [Kocuria rhizophila]